MLLDVINNIINLSILSEPKSTVIGDTGIKYYYRYFRLNIYGGAKHTCCIHICLNYILFIGISILTQTTK